MWNLLVRVLDLEALRGAEPGSVSLRFQTPWSDWVVFLTLILSVLFVALTYDRERIPTRLRIALTAMRGAVVLLAVALLCRPVLVWERTRDEPSVAALLVDVSASMDTRDVYTDEREEEAMAFAVKARRGKPPAGQSGEGPPVSELPSRYSLLGSVLFGSSAEDSPLGKCLEVNRVAIYTFGTALRALSTASSPDELEAVLQDLRKTAPGAQTTDIAGALDQVVGEARVGRLAAVILATDGRATVPGDYRRLIDVAKRRRVPIISILVGSTSAPVDVSVGPLLAEENVFVKDIVAIRGTLTANLSKETEIELQLFEKRRDEPLATEKLVVGGATREARFEFRARPFRPGPHEYRVVSPSLPNEINLENNASQVQVNAVEDKIRVLYVEAYPRFEYRYIKNTLLREPTIVSSVLLLSADEGFAQEGTAPVQRFPETEEELFGYDVVMFGDVDPRSEGAEGGVGWLSARQAELLVDFVGRRGGGFILIAGQRSAPHTFRGTPLEKLLPVMIDPQYLGLPGEFKVGETESNQAARSGFQILVTPEGHDSPVFRFAEDSAENAEIIAALPRVYWFAPSLGPKPAAEVFAQHPVERTLSGPMPLVVTGRYGAGRTYFHGTDDTWRWRRETGEAFHETYWLQAIRFCTENRLLNKDRAIRFFADRHQYEYSQPVRITLRTSGAELAASLPPEIAARYVSVDRRRAGRFKLVRLGPGARNFEGQFTPPTQGAYLVSAEVDVPGREPSHPQVRIDVRPTHLEMLNSQADHETLRHLAEQTGGEVLYLDELGRLEGLLPDRRVKIPDDLAEPIWDTRFVLGLLVLILSMEWGLRKWFGLI